VSSADSDFNFDFGVSYTDEQVREQMGPILEGESRLCCARWRPQPGPTWLVTSRKDRA
jgi:hypothetical protein